MIRMTPTWHPNDEQDRSALKRRCHTEGIPYHDQWTRDQLLHARKLMTAWPSGGKTIAAIIDQALAEFDLHAEVTG